MEEHFIGLVEAEEKKELRVAAGMLVLATSYITVLLTEIQMLGGESRVLFWPVHLKYLRDIPIEGSNREGDEQVWVGVRAADRDGVDTNADI